MNVPARVVVAVCVVALLATGCSDNASSQAWFPVGVDGDSITIGIAHAECEDIDVSVDETPREVTISVRLVRPRFGKCEMAGRESTRTIQLKRPLGTRALIDGACGRAVETTASGLTNPCTRR